MSHEFRAFPDESETSGFSFPPPAACQGGLFPEERGLLAALQSMIATGADRPDAPAPRADAAARGLPAGILAPLSA